MRLVSTLSKSEGSAPVAIFSLGDEQMFLHISEDYQDVRKQIIEGFNLDEDVLLSLRTSAIDVCEGKEVKIPERAYIFLWKFLDKVTVNIVERSQVGQQKRAQEKSRAISPIALESLSSHFTDVSFSTASNTVVLAEAPINEVRERSRTPMSDGIGRGTALSKVAHTTGGSVDHPQKSRKHADDEHGDDQPQVLQEKIVPLKPADLQPIITKLEDNGEGGSNLQARFRPPVALLPKSNNEISSPTTIKKEILTEHEVTLLKRPEIIKPSTPPPLIPDENPRFEITIISPKNELAQFKTRGKHPVRKVLAAACKTFGVKYERARLVLCVSTEEGGKILTDEFDCPPEETMSQCGVDSNAKLFVRGEPDHDGYEEYL